jgi:4-oxalmesaconate hydratase
MVIDSHAHVTAPDGLYVYKAGILSHRGSHGRGEPPGMSDDDVRHAMNKPVFNSGSHLEQLKEAGTDMQVISPRPYQLMHSEDPKLVRWWVEENNNIVSREAKMMPDVFRGVGALPQSPGVSPAECVGELERCVRDLGLVGILINPDPGECSGVETPPMGDRFWYPLYEKLVELDVPGQIHSAGCRSGRLSYSLHFINEESIAVVSILNSRVFDDFPSLKIIVSHGGGAVPYHVGRFNAGTYRRGGKSFLEKMNLLWYDTVLYSAGALELLFRTVGPERCLFGTERPGVGTVKNPETGLWLDDTRPIIERFDWLTADEKKMIFEDNARKVFNLTDI